MSIGAISGTGSLHAAYEQFRAKGGASKDDLSKLQSSLQDSNSPASQRLGSLIIDFDKIDVNKDGKLDGSELSTYRKSKGGGHGGHSHKCDGDAFPADGISQDELTELDGKAKAAGDNDTDLGQLIQSFNVADTNKDGKVDATELAAYDKADSEKTATGDSSSGKLITPGDLQKLLKLYGSTQAPPNQPSLLQEVSA